MKNWIVAQLGAREHYAIARALHRRGALDTLLTDIWAAPGDVLGKTSQRFRERYHSELQAAQVYAPSMNAVAHEIFAKVNRRSGWDQIMRRNAWFQRAIADRLNQMSVGRDSAVFAYSYAAEGILEAAKAKGALTVLGQIDPGLAEAKQISAVYESAGEAFEIPPESYWQAWKRETKIADIILVNSEWSREGLVAEGVDANKIQVLPLALELEQRQHVNNTPAVYTHERPLRALFLGQVNLRKGIDALMEAVLSLPDAPIQLDVVGPVQVSIPEAISRDSRIVLLGSVPRGNVQAYYDNADIFLFPTRSDGFGLTQLESLAAGVPIIASKNCGNVVQDGENGLLIEQVSADSIASVLTRLINERELVSNLQSKSQLGTTFSLEALGAALEDMVR
ncbi:MAG: glycosyltransferase family 4 protein [Henriciella sp.]|nr:glycosyltransferase family 4 protein [Henriciella sp.]